MNRERPCDEAMRAGRRTKAQRFAEAAELVGQYGPGNAEACGRCNSDLMAVVPSASQGSLSQQARTVLLWENGSPGGS